MKQTRLTPLITLTCVLWAGISVAKAQNTTLITIEPATIDHYIRAEWKKEQIVPAPPVDDARYLRRIYLDIVGTIPPAEAVTAFLADKSSNKRAVAVENLLSSPRYAEHWTNYWDNVLMGRSRKPGMFVDRSAFRQWLHTQFEKNTPWNKFVLDLVSATGQNSTGGSYAKAAGVMMRQNEMDTETTTTAGSGSINGAVNWTLKYAQTPADLAGSASKIFLGVQIQCAQCHDHKTEKWKQEDFRRFTACFVQARPQPIDKGKVMGIRRVDLEDVNRPLQRFPQQKKREDKEYVNALPTALDGTEFSNSPNRRKALATWMTSPQNPWFGEAIVNRMWAHFLGRGFVEPIDDFRPSNPAIIPDLLTKIAEDFRVRDYDLKQLIRTICATQVYQLSSNPAKQADEDNKFWARYRLKPLGPEPLLDSMVQATNLMPVLEQVAGNNLEGLKAMMQRQFMFLFDVDEESEQKDFEGTIPQALMLLNGNLTNRGVSPIPGSALATALNLPGNDAEKIEALYLRTVSRKPTTAELKKWTAFVNASREAVRTDSPTPTAEDNPRRKMLQRMLQKPGMKRNNGPDPLARLGNRLDTTQTPKQQAYEDLFWALLNSSEFMFNH